MTENLALTGNDLYALAFCCLTKCSQFHGSSRTLTSTSWMPCNPYSRRFTCSVRCDARGQALEVKTMSTSTCPSFTIISLIRPRSTMSIPTSGSITSLNAFLISSSFTRLARFFSPSGHGRALSRYLRIDQSGGEISAIGYFSVANLEEFAV